MAKVVATARWGRRIAAVSALALVAGAATVIFAGMIPADTGGAALKLKLAVKAASGQQPRPTSLAAIKFLQGHNLNLTLMGTLEGQDFLIARSAEGEAQPVLISPSGHSYLYGGIPFDDKGMPLLMEFFPKGSVAAEAPPPPVVTPVAAPQLPVPAVAAAGAPPPLPVVKVSPATDDALHALGRVAAISYGESGPDLFVVVDPSCTVCRAVWPAMKAMADAGAVSLHLVPVGLVNDKSIERSIGILSSTDPARAWDDAMKGAFVSGPSGSVTPEELEKIDSEALFAAVDLVANLVANSDQKGPDGKASQERLRSDILSAGIDRLTQNMGDASHRRLLKYAKLVRLNSQAVISAHVQGTPAFFGRNAAGRPWHFDGELPNGDIKALLTAAEVLR